MFVFLVFLSLFNGLFGQNPNPLLWPLPSTFTVSSDLELFLSPASFNFTTSSSNVIIQRAMERYQHITFPHFPEGTLPTTNIITSLDISIKDDSDTLPYFNMDESYQLKVSKSSSIATLTSNSIWGALRGLETFSQSVIYNFSIGYYGCYSVDINDKPRFSHRGILQDTARHFQTIDSLRMLLDAMSFNKFNVLHWHITDDQSFPLESKSNPKLWDGSYTKYERYSLNDINEIVQHATDRGIRVIPEFDMPGHARSWCDGYPDICPTQSCTSPMNVASQTTWDVLQRFITEMSVVFPDKYMHLGGDEVNTNCWTKTPSIQQWMTDNNFTATQALQFFDLNAMMIANNQTTNSKKVINWDEVFTTFNKGQGLNPDVTIVQVWHSGPSLMQQVVAAGFQGIMSPDPIWYLDSLSNTWSKRYVLEPLTGISDPKQQALVIGGEGCMWGETVDVSDIEQTIWPTAAAIAERLWSPRNVNDTTKAKPRMEYFRCLLNERGIAAAPTNNGGNRAAPPGPGSCYSQRRRL